MVLGWALRRVRLGTLENSGEAASLERCASCRARLLFAFSLSQGRFSRFKRALPRDCSGKCDTRFFRLGALQDGGTCEACSDGLGRSEETLLWVFLTGYVIMMCAAVLVLSDQALDQASVGMMVFQQVLFSIVTLGPD